MKKPTIHFERPKIQVTHFSDKSAIISTIILILIGILVIVLIATSQAKSNGWIETDAIITKISDNNTYVKFWVDGHLYKDISLHAYDSTFYINQVIKIKYNPVDPTQIEYAKQGFFNVFYILGASTILIGIAVSVVHFSIKAYRKKNPKYINGIGEDQNN